MIITITLRPTIGPAIATAVTQLICDLPSPPDDTFREVGSVRLLFARVGGGNRRRKANFDHSVHRLFARRSVIRLTRETLYGDTRRLASHLHITNFANMRARRFSRASLRYATRRSSEQNSRGSAAPRLFSTMIKTLLRIISVRYIILPNSPGERRSRLPLRSVEISIARSIRKRAQARANFLQEERAEAKRDM